jgi:hypothetical protein
MPRATLSDVEKDREPKPGGKLSIPMPFEAAIAAALETPPEPEDARPFGKRARPKPDRPVRSKKK